MALVVVESLAESTFSTRMAQRRWMKNYVLTYISDKETILKALSEDFRCYCYGIENSMARPVLAVLLFIVTHETLEVS